MLSLFNKINFKRSFLSTTTMLALMFGLIGVVPVSAADGANIAQWLNSDGTLNLSSDYHGNLDITGYNVRMDPMRGPIFHPQTTEDIWNPVGTPASLDSEVFAVAVSGSNVYVGGWFWNAGGNPDADYIAKWDGTSWSALGTIPLNSHVWTIVAHGANLYVGGSFTNAGGNPNADSIAIWNGTSWLALGQGLNDTVFAIAINGSDVYLGGKFTNAGGATYADYIVKWNGTGWSALGYRPFNDWVYSIAIDVNGMVYAGGNFKNAGDNINADYLAKWNGTGWTAVGNIPLSGLVYAVATTGTDVYAGGDFHNAGGNPNADYVARWSGSEWHSLGTDLIGGSPINDTVRSIGINGSDVYIGGYFTHAGMINHADYVAKWTGYSWSNLGYGAQGNVLVVYLHANNVYIGGSFTGAGSTPGLNYAARFGQPPAPTATPTVTMTATKTRTPTRTTTTTKTITPTITLTRKPTYTQTPTPAYTASPTSSISPRATNTATATGNPITIISRTLINEAAGESGNPAISSDGKYAAFASDAPNLVANDTNNKADIFVRRLSDGEMMRVSLSSGGAQADENSYMPSLSADGRYVAFASEAGNLVGGDTNSRVDIFVHDRQTGITTRVSMNSSGVQGFGDSFEPSISADGRYVAFLSDSVNLVAGDTNNLRDLFVHDRQTGQTRRVSVSSSGVQANSRAEDGKISGNGRYVVFTSEATNLVGNDANGGLDDVFLHDLGTSETRLVVFNAQGAQANHESRHPSISQDGRYVAFASFANNLVENDTNDNYDIFRRDLLTGEVTLVSLNNNGEQINHGAFNPVISNDGRFVSFTSQATNLVDTANNGMAQVFLMDIVDQEVMHLSKSAENAPASQSCSLDRVAASGDGRLVVFSSYSGNLVPVDSNNTGDIFLVDPWDSITK